MAVSAILVLDLKGKVLLARDYRGDVPLKQVNLSGAFCNTGQHSRASWLNNAGLVVQEGNDHTNFF